MESISSMQKFIIHALVNAFFLRNRNDVFELWLLYRTIHIETGTAPSSSIIYSTCRNKTKKKIKKIAFRQVFPKLVTNIFPDTGS